MQIQYVVLDEADMMLNVGFADDVEHILSGVPEQRQTMLFSATMPSWVKGLTQKYLKTPVLVDLVGDSASGKINESVRCAHLQLRHDSWPRCPWLTSQRRTHCLTCCC